MWAWVLMGLSSLTLVVAVIGISVMVGVGSGSTTVFPAAQTSKNATACKLFEDGYNQLADALRAKVSSAAITAHDMLPSRIKDAEDQAEGDVAVALRDARELAPRLGWSSDDAGLAFFMSTHTVVQKC